MPCHYQLLPNYKPIAFQGHSSQEVQAKIIPRNLALLYIETKEWYTRTTVYSQDKNII